MSPYKELGTPGEALAEVKTKRIKRLRRRLWPYTGHAEAPKPGDIVEHWGKPWKVVSSFSAIRVVHLCADERSALVDYLDVVPL